MSLVNFDYAQGQIAINADKVIRVASSNDVTKSVIEVDSGNNYEVTGSFSEVTTEIENALPNGGGGGGTEVVKIASVTLSNAQILDLHNTPVVIVPTPGAGKLVRVLSGTTSSLNNTIAGFGGPFAISYLGGNTIISAGVSNILSASSVNTFNLTTPSSNQSSPNTDVVARASSPITGCDGQLMVIVVYCILDVA